MTNSMARKHWLRRTGFCTQCGLTKTPKWRCRECSLKQAACAKTRRVK